MKKLKKFFAIARISFAFVTLFVGCARTENAGYGSGAAPAAERGEAPTENSVAVPNTGAAAASPQSEPFRDVNSVRTNVTPGSATAFDTNIISPDAATGKGAGENQNLDGAPTPPAPQNPGSAR